MQPSVESKQRPEASSDRPQPVQAARSLIGEQQQAAATSLGEFAGVLRRAAQESDGSGSAARIAESAADNLQRLADSLRNRDLDALLRDAESFARRQPALFIGAAAVAGFLAVRFLKSSDPAEPRDPSL